MALTLVDINAAVNAGASTSYEIAVAIGSTLGELIEFADANPAVAAVLNARAASIAHTQQRRNRPNWKRAEAKLENNHGATVVQKYDVVEVQLPATALMDTLKIPRRTNHDFHIVGGELRLFVIPE